MELDDNIQYTERSSKTLIRFLSSSRSSCSLVLI